jgi:hypothetical protein
VLKNSQELGIIGSMLFPMRWMHKKEEGGGEEKR